MSRRIATRTALPDPAKTVAPRRYRAPGCASAVGIVLLLAITSVAVLRIFRIETHTLNRWQALIAPGLGLVGIVLFVAIIFQNPPVLVGEDGYGPFS